jgi:hypothetical protein
MSREKVVKLKVESNVKNITDEYKGLNEEIKEQGKLVDETNTSFEKLDETTSKYTNKASEGFKKVAEQSKKIKQNIKGGTQAFEGGATAVQFYGDSLSLVGAESEKLDDSLKKVDQAMRLSKGVAGVRKSITAIKGFTATSKTATKVQLFFGKIMGKSTGMLKAFRLALISTGIGALVIGVGLLIANFEKLLDVFSPITDGLKSLGDAIGLTSFAEDERKEKIKSRLEAQQKAYEQEVKNHNQRMDAYRQEQAEQDKLLGKEIELAKARGEDTTDMQRQQLEQRLADLKKNLAKEEKAYMDADDGWLQSRHDEIVESNEAILFLQKKGVKEFSQLNFEAQDEFRKTFRFGMSRSIEGLKTQIKQANESITYEAEVVRKRFGKTTQAQIDEAQKNIEIFEARNTASEKAEQKKKNDNYKTYLQNRLNAERQMEDMRNSLLEEGIEKDLTINETKFKRLREDALKNTNLTRTEKKALEDLYDQQEIQAREKINQKYVDLEKAKNEKIDKINQKENADRIAREDAQYQLELQLQADRQEAEIILLTQKYDKQFELASGNAELEKMLTEQMNLDIANINQKFRDEEAKKEADALNLRKQNEMSKVEMGLSALTLISNIADSMAGEDVERQKKAFNIKKAVDIAQATMDGYKAVLSAYAQAPVGFKIPASIIAGGFSALQIGNIAKQKFQSPEPDDLASGGGGGGGEPSVPATPEFNIISGAELTDTEGVGQQPLQAFVVSTEVTTAQGLDRNRVENATI